MAAPAHIARENGKKGGRPKGATSKPAFRDHITEKDIEAWLEILRDQIVQDNKLLMWALDHVYGKAPQTIDGALETNLVLTFDPTFNASSQKAAGNSTK